LALTSSQRTVLRSPLPCASWSCQPGAHCRFWPSSGTHIGGLSTPAFFGGCTKVTRCLTDGRQAFARRLAGIEAGVECERFAPLLSALADGEASAEQLALLRPHMRTCLACRARLKAFRAVPARVAALVPQAALVVAGAGPLGTRLETAMGAAQQRLEAMVGATQQRRRRSASAPTRWRSWRRDRRWPRSRPRRWWWPAAARRWSISQATAMHGGRTRSNATTGGAKAKPVKEEVAVRVARVPAEAPAPKPDPQPPQPAPNPAPSPEPAPARRHPPAPPAQPAAA